jgi:hypothetical protein
MRLLQNASIFSLSAIVTALPVASLPAGAQTMDTAGPHSPYCGSWQNNSWVPNGSCVEETVTTTTTTTAVPVAVPAPDARMRGRVSGTITIVKGHLVTLQQATQSIVINDQPALGSQATGRVAVGRSVVAHGYWENGTFYATRIEGA